MNRLPVRAFEPRIGQLGGNRQNPCCRRQDLQSGKTERVEEFDLEGECFLEDSAVSCERDAVNFDVAGCHVVAVAPSVVLTVVVPDASANVYVYVGDAAQQKLMKRMMIMLGRT